MRNLVSVAAIGLAGLLSACFMSETPFVPDADLVSLPDENVRFCTDEDDCADASLAEDGSYILMPPPEEDDAPVPIRLAALTQNDLGRIWLAEIPIEEDDETVYTVGVVRRAPEFDTGLPGYEIALPDCHEFTPEEAEAYGIEKIDKGTCHVPASMPVAEFLRAAYAERLNDPEWWVGED
ncbi:MAG: hypothetical protein KDA53_08685 [Hyphomonas sp.]|nr:hypothetical protein [Hyphomonas sp.]